MLYGSKLAMLSATIFLVAGYGTAVHARASDNGCVNHNPNADPAPAFDNCDYGTGVRAETSAVSSPEIDGAGALAAIATLGGVLAVAGERRRRSKS